MLKYTCKKDSAISNLTGNNLKGYYIFMYKYIITKNISKKGRDANMTSIAKTNDTLKKNREQFTNELKMFINQKLFDKHIISEDMYYTAKEVLLKQAS